MKDLEILKQLYYGNHLEKDELKRAKEIVAQMQLQIKQRWK